MAEFSDKKQYLKRWSELKNERSSWLEHWRDLSQHVHPRTGRFLLDAPGAGSRGEKRNSKIINSKATVAARTLSSGMMSGITSPARSWFRLTTPDPALDEVDTVRQWLHDVEDRIRTAFAKSNIYKGLHLVYRDLGTPGTAVMHLEEDVEDVLRVYVFPIGQYCLANSDRLKVDTCYRELGMTTRQLVKRFGLANCSTFVQTQHKRKSLDGWHQVLHVIEPNDEYVPGRFGAGGMKWRSVWLEMTGAGDKMLNVGGYRECPFVAPRWETTGEDVYGSSPGMEALGDIRALQHLEKKAGQAFEKVVTPPMRAPMELQNMLASLVPGDVTFVPSTAGNAKFEPAMEIQPAALAAFAAKIQEHERRINEAYFANVWQSITMQEGQMTATEVLARQQEQMLLLGPVMETLQDELLDPIISRTFAILWRRGMIPDPPDELQGAQLRVEYISVMAQAQKQLGTQAVERLTGFVANIAAAGRPDAYDNVNIDKTISEYGLMLSVPPSMVRSDDQVAAIRAQRAQKQQQAQEVQQALVAAKGAKDLSQASLEGDNGLSRLVGNTSGPIAQAAVAK